MKFGRFYLCWPFKLIRLPDRPIAGLFGYLDIRHIHNGKVATKIKVGTELHRDTNTLQYRERYIDQLHEDQENSYREYVVNPVLGDNIEKYEKYSDHRRQRT